MAKKKRSYISIFIGLWLAGSVLSGLYVYYKIKNAPTLAEQLGFLIRNTPAQQLNKSTIIQAMEITYAQLVKETLPYKDYNNGASNFAWIFVDDSIIILSVDSNNKVAVLWHSGKGDKKENWDMYIQSGFDTDFLKNAQSDFNIQK